MKKAIGLAIVGLFVISLIGIVSAEDITVNQNSNWWSNFQHSLGKFGLFTAEGQSRQCSVNAVYTWNPVTANTAITKATLQSKCSGPSFLVDVFDTSWYFISEYRSEIIPSGGLNAGPSNKIYEIYCCPYIPCSSNSGCSSAPASNYGNTCNTAYGSCYSIAPTHSTKVYQCTNGNWNYLYSVSSGASHFCSSSSNNNYIDQSGNEHCASSPSSSWCTAGSQCKTNSQSCTDNSQCCSGLTCQNFGCYAPSNECTSGQTSSCTIQNGQGTKTCSSNGAWAACIVTSCNSGYVLVNNQCIPAQSEEVCQYIEDKDNCNLPGGLCEWDYGFLGIGAKCKIKTGTTGNNNTGTKNVWESCSNDLECISTHCDKNHWYSISQTCQPTPWDEIYRVGFTREQIGDATVNELVGIACIDGNHCVSPSENYTAKCISLNKLKDDGTLEIGTTTFFDTTHTLINRGAIGGIVGALTCAGGVVATIITAPTVAGSAVFGTIAATACTTLIAGGAILGANTAIGMDDKNEIVKALNANDADSVGLCVAEPSSTSLGGLSKYTEWAAFVNITGDKGVDGLIIIFILIMLMVIILK